MKKSRSAYLLEKLEPRLLFSADLALLPLDGGTPAVDQDILLSIPLRAESTVSQQYESFTQAEHEVVFVDAGVADYQVLINDIQAQREGGRQVETVLLDLGQDGIAQISTYLNSQQDISAIHIISHGSNGEVVLGNSFLNSTTLDSYAGLIEGWQQSLTDQADLLFYGCNLASGEAGQTLISSLSFLTGADVAASNDVTGQVAMGGDWDLEYATGKIESVVAVSQNVQQNWAQQLLDSKPEFLVNTSTGGTQETSAQARGSEHAVAMDTAGNYVVVWSDSVSDGSGYGIFAQRFNAAGTAQGSEVQINQTTTDNQYWARVAMADDGTFTITWTSVNQDGTASSIYARQFNTDGTPVAAEFRVNTQNGGGQTNSSIDMAANGDFIIVWQGRGPGDNDGIFFRRFNADGSAIDATDQLANQTDDGNEQDPVVTIQASGNFVIAWEISSDCYFQRFNSSGAVLGTKVKVNGLGMLPTTSSRLAVDSDSSGNFTFVCREDTAFVSGIYHRAFNEDGTEKYSYSRIASGDATNPSISMDDAGNYLVTYEKTGDGDALGVYGQRYDSSGSSLDSAFLINETTSGTQHLVSAAMLNIDNYVTVWSGNGSGDATGVYARQFSAGNSAPVAVADSFTVDEGSTTNLNLAGNDTDADGNLDLTSIVIILAPSHGSIDSVNADGTVDYTHDGSETVSDSFSYTIDDLSSATSNTVTVSLTITPVNDVPTLTNFVSPVTSGDEDNEITITFADLTGEGDEADVDGTVEAFIVKSVISGILKIGTSAGTATAWAAGTNDTLNATTNAYWTPAADANGTLNAFAVVAEDNDGTESDTSIPVPVTVNPVNDAPVITSTAVTAATEDSPYNYTFTVTDVDAGDTLTLGAQTLPDWLSFNSTTGLLSGTPSNADVGDHPVVLQVWDGTTLEAQSFTITVTNVNDAPIVDNPIPDQMATEDSVFNFQFAANTFNDVDGDTLNYTSDASGWLSFDAATRTFTGTPLNVDVGTTTVTVTADDGNGETVSDSFDIIINNTNDAPVITSTANTTATEDSSYSYTFTARDVDASDTLTLGAPTLPAWLSFNSTTGILSGTPTNSDVGNHSIILRVNDGTVDVEQSFMLTVTNTNDAPTAINLDNTSVAENLSGVVVGRLTTSDVDSGDSHSYLVDDSRFEVVAGQLKLKAGQSLDYETEPSVAITVTSRDAAGLSVSQGFTLMVTDANDNPVPVSDHLNTVEDNSLTLTTVADLLSNDTDPDGNLLSLSSFDQPAHGYLVDNGDGTLTYTPANNFCHTDSFDYVVSDGHGGIAGGTAFIVVTPVGDTPQVTDVSTYVGTQSGLITVTRNAADGSEVGYFKISAISGGTLFLTDGATVVNNGDFISASQGQAGLRFTPAEGIEEGHFQVEASEDGIVVAAQSGVATATIRVVAQPTTPVQEQPLLGNTGQPAAEKVADDATEAAEEAIDSTETAEITEQAAEISGKKGGGTSLPGEVTSGVNIGAGRAALRVGNPFNMFIRQMVAHENNKDIAVSSNSSLLQSLALQLETTPLETLKNTWDALDITPLTRKDYDLVRKSFDAIQDEITADGKIENAVVSSAIVTSMGLSAGYVFWMLKGGSLLASVLSSMPAWHLADPLSILSGMKQSDEDDESLENIIQQGAERTTGSDEDEMDD